MANEELPLRGGSSRPSNTNLCCDILLLSVSVPGLLVHAVAILRGRPDVETYIVSWIEVDLPNILWNIPVRLCFNVTPIRGIHQRSHFLWSVCTTDTQLVDSIPIPNDLAVVVCGKTIRVCDVSPLQRYISH